MRILILTNFYPPYALGGQEQSCQQVGDDLRRRSHQVLVLTSRHGTGNEPESHDHVCRRLFLEMDLVPWRQSITFFTERKARERYNIQCFHQLADCFNPDVIFIWGMWNLPRSLPAYAEAQYPDKVAYRFADYWPTLPSQHELYWRTPGRNRLARIPKSLLRAAALALLARERQRPALRFPHAMSVSAATRDILVESGVPVAHARVIHTGIDVMPYLDSEIEPSLRAAEDLQYLLYAGRLAPDKGVDLTIEAVAKLVADRKQRNVQLIIAGAGSPEYEQDLRQRVHKSGLEKYVHFLGYVPRIDMPKVLRSCDVLLVPSTWQEPFARIVLEGLGSGLAVIATPTGGTKEILVHGENGLFFRPNDAGDLARQIEVLINDAELRSKVAQAGQQMVMERFTFDGMMNEIEQFLHDVSTGASPVRQCQPAGQDELRLHTVSS